MIENIQEDFRVESNDGETIGTVDHREGANLLKLKKADSPDGKHNYLPVELIESVEEGVVYLSCTRAEAQLQMKQSGAGEEKEFGQSDETAPPASGATKSTPGMNINQNSDRPQNLAS